MDSDMTDSPSLASRFFPALMWFLVGSILFCLFWGGALIGGLELFSWLKRESNEIVMMLALFGFGLILVCLVPIFWIVPEACWAAAREAWRDQRTISSSGNRADRSTDANRSDG